jgi:hypothetical protein
MFQSISVNSQAIRILEIKIAIVASVMGVQVSSSIFGVTIYMLI